MLRGTNGTGENLSRHHRKFTLVAALITHRSTIPRGRFITVTRGLASELTRSRAQKELGGSNRQEHASGEESQPRLRLIRERFERAGERFRAGGGEQRRSYGGREPTDLSKPSHVLFYPGSPPLLPLPARFNSAPRLDGQPCTDFNRKNRVAEPKPTEKCSEHH